MMKRPDLAQLRAMSLDGARFLRDLMVRSGIVGLVVLLVLGAGVLAATIPLPGTDCPSALKSAFTGQVTMVPKSAPVLSPSVIDADELAISVAEKALSGHADAMSEASKTAKAAARLSEQAQSAVDTSLEDDTSSLEYDVDSAKSTLVAAQEAVERDAKNLRKAEGEASLGSYYEGQVDYAEDELAAAKAELATARSKLAQAKKKLSRMRASVAAAERKAKALTTKADQATAEATVLSESATSTQKALLSAVASAKEQLSEHVVASQVAVSTWTHQRRQAVDANRALNSVRRSCRATGHSTLAVAGGLGGVAALLAIGNIVAVRRRPAPDGRY